jgi:hypothetical protein
MGMTGSGTETVTVVIEATITSLESQTVICPLQVNAGSGILTGQPDVSRRPSAVSSIAYRTHAVVFGTACVMNGLDDPQRHPGAVARLLGRRSQPTINQSGGEWPGRKVDGRR